MVDKDEKLIFVKEKGEEDRTTGHLKRNYPDKIKKLEEA